MKLTKSKKRVKEQGEVFTPPILVNQLLDAVEDRLKDCSKTILDPTCGNDNILVEVLRRRIDLGCDKIAALSTIYGIDIMQDNIDECKNRLKKIIDLEDDRIESILNNNVICANTLEINTFFEKNIQ
jgi:hypothetical protein